MQYFENSIYGKLQIGPWASISGDKMTVGRLLDCARHYKGDMLTRFWFKDSYRRLQGVWCLTKTWDVRGKVCSVEILITARKASLRTAATKTVLHQTGSLIQFKQLIQMFFSKSLGVAFMFTWQRPIQVKGQPSWNDLPRRMSHFRYWKAYGNLDTH